MTYEDFTRDMLMPFLKKKRGYSETYIEYISSLLENYEEYIDSTKGNGLVDKKSEISEILNYIINVIDNFNRGNLYDAIVEASFLSLHKWRLYDTTSKNNYWYRARILDEGRSSFDPIEMFHAPFQLRHKLNNNRFSISGYPCLYLGRSILACWEEMKRPSLDKLCISCFKMHKPLKILDLTIPDENDEMWNDNEKTLKLLITWPLVMACSIKTKHPNDPFKEEYIFPQLLIQSILQYDEFDGVAYTSTRKDDFLRDEMELHTNLAIPVKKVKEDGFCEALKSAFEITKGMSLIEAQIKNQIGHHNYYTNNDDELDDGDIVSEYDKTLFGQMERMLNVDFDNLKCEKL